MSDSMSVLPQAEVADPDGVQVALRAAHTLWSHGDTAESLRWLSRAAESASDEGADVRSLQLAKAAAELRSRLVGSLAPGSSPVAGGQSSIPHAKQGMSRPVSQSLPPLQSPSLAPSRPPALVATPFVAARPTDIPMAAIPVSSGGHSPGGLNSSPPSWSPPVDSSPPPLPGFGDPMAAVALPSAALPSAALPSAALPSAALAGESGNSHAVGAEPPPSDMQHWLASSVPPAAPDGATPLVASLPAASVPMASPASVERRHNGGTVSSAPVFTESVLPEARIDYSIPPPLPPTSYGQPEPELPDEHHPEQHTIAIESLDEDSAPLSEGGIYAVKPPNSGRAFAANSAPAIAREGVGAVALAAPDLALGESSSPGSAPNGERAPEVISATLAPPEQPRLSARVHHQAVRVAILADSLSEGQFVVRPLREGESAPQGAKVALLVALEPGMPLV